MLESAEDVSHLRENDIVFIAPVGADASVIYNLFQQHVHGRIEGLPCVPYNVLEIPRSALRMDATPIYQGPLSSVFKGVWRESAVAIKILRGTETPNAITAFNREMAVLSSLRHPRILTLIAVCRDMSSTTEGGSSDIALITEYMLRGTLYSTLHHEDSRSVLSLTLRDKLCIAVDISEGMRFLHHADVIHRDLKSQNILLSMDGRAKIADFGLSAFKQATCTNVTGLVGTVAWSSPEALLGQPLRSASDVYSFGVVIWELLTGDVPWGGVEMIAIITAVALLHNRLPLPLPSPHSPPSLIAPTESCFGAVETRPSFDDIYTLLNEELLRVIRDQDNAVPDAFICPIRYELMRDPVMCADGHSYERAAITEWLAQSNRSPKTNLELTSRVLIANHALRAAIEGLHN